MISKSQSGEVIESQRRALRGILWFLAAIVAPVPLISALLVALPVRSTIYPALVLTEIAGVLCLAAMPVRAWVKLAWAAAYIPLYAVLLNWYAPLFIFGVLVRGPM